MIPAHETGPHQPPPARAEPTEQESAPSGRPGPAPTIRLDVTTWPGYHVIRDIRSLCTTLFALRHATASPEGRAQADHRLACLRGTAGPSPKPWSARKWQWARPAAPSAVQPA